MTQALPCLDRIFSPTVTQSMVAKALDSRPSLVEEPEAMENCKECLVFIQPLFVDHKKPAKALAMTVALLTYFRLMVLSNLQMAAPQVNWGDFYKFDEDAQHSPMQERVAALRGFQNPDVVKLKIEECTAAVQWLETMVFHTNGTYLPFLSGSWICLSDALVHFKHYALVQFNMVYV